MGGDSITFNGGVRSAAWKKHFWVWGLAALSISGVFAVVIGTAGASPLHTAAATLAVSPSLAKHPSAREGQALAYDPKDGYSVLFGGYTGSAFLSDTWEYASGSWTKLAEPVHPPARSGAAMAYDAKDGYLLLFGGNNAAGVLHDTWAFSNGTWTKLHLPSAPAGRFSSSMAYDAKDGYIVLFGGGGLSNTFFNDTWKFTHGHWTELSSASPPIARRAAGMTYDARDGYVVMFGGLSGIAGDVDDTWIFSHGGWTQILPTTSPGDLVAPGMTYDAKDRMVILFGGRDDNTLTVYATTWEFRGGQWTPLSPSGPTPPARDITGMTFDAADHYVLMFGGSHDYSGTVLGDTWRFSADAWS